MYRFVVTWYDRENDLTIQKRIELDDSTVEDMAIEGVNRGYIRDLLTSLDADVESDY